MKSRTILSLSATALTLLAGFVAAQSKPTTGFAQLKTLVGQWDGKTESGKPVRASYKLVSGGTALLESLTPADEAEMVTLYSADGDHVAATHYCSTGNQPQMRTPPITGAVREFAFSFVSATNLPSPTAGHMHRLVLILEDNDHLTQKWTWRENGSDKTEVFHFTRKKS